MQQDEQGRRHGVAPGHEPTTPALWLVVWSSTTAGYATGWVDASAIPGSYFPGRLTTLMTSFYEQVAGREARALSRPGDCPPSQPRCLNFCMPMTPSRAWFVAAHFLATACAALPAAWLTRMAGRRVSIIVSACVFVIGMLLQATAFSWQQLLAGNLLVGAAVALLQISVWAESAEVAPARWRGAFLCCFTLGEAIGFMVCLVLLTTSATGSFISLDEGWRLSIVLGGWPALVLLAVSAWIPDSPPSLVQRSKLAEARDSLMMIRGAFYPDINAELTRIYEAAGRPPPNSSSRAYLMLRQLRELFVPRSHMPPLILGILFSLFREAVSAFVTIAQAVEPLVALAFPVTPRLTGVTVVGAAGVLGAALAVATVDTVGRRPLILGGSSVMAVCAAVMWGLLQSFLAADTQARRSSLAKALLSLFAVTMLAGYASVEPLFPLILTENQPLATRTHAIALGIGLDALTSAITTALWGVLSCQLQGHVLLVVTGCCSLVALIMWLLLPETAQVPLELVQQRWEHWWAWRAFYTPKPPPQGSGGAAAAAAAAPAGAACALGVQLPQRSTSDSLPALAYTYS